MASCISLSSMFESQHHVIEEQLQGLFLPKDADKVKKVVSSYFNEIFDDQGEYRQNLTQSEDYILQAALSLLNAQQEIGKVIESTNNVEKKISSLQNESPIATLQIDSKIPTAMVENVDYSKEKISFRPNFFETKVESSSSLIGAGGGALIGNVLLGGWGAVFGAIAGTSVTLYLSSLKDSTEQSKSKVNFERPKAIPVQKVQQETSVPIDVKHFLDITLKICESVDNLIATFRAQINRVVSKYENQEKPSLEREYRPLLEGIQTLVGYSRTHATDEKFLSKIQQRIEDLAEVLDNYNMTFEDYSPEKENWFSLVPSQKATETKMVYPAIVKDGYAIIKGKAFIPADKD